MNIYKLITVKQVAQITGMSDATIRKEIDRYNLPAIQLGKHFKVHLGELEQYCIKESLNEKRRFFMYPYVAQEFYNRVQMYVEDSF